MGRSLRPRWWPWCAVVIIGSAVVGCSGGDDAVGPSSDPIVTESPTTATVTSTSPTTPDAETTTPTTDHSDSAVTIATVVEGGVPGLDSVDPFCSAWSRFAGSFQALADASNFGDPTEAIRLEVAASDAVAAAVVDLDRHLPPEVDGEREQFIDGLIGPFAVRAVAARAAMLTAGLDEQQVAAIGDVWLDALADAGLGTLEVTVEIPIDARAAFDASVTAFGSSTPSIIDDPTLVTDASAPATMSYVEANCPDQGILGGNDIVGD